MNEKKGKVAKNKHSNKTNNRDDNSDDESSKELRNKNVNMNQHSEMSAQFKRYLDEIHEYYQQQHAYLEEQNAICFQQLFQIICQGQQNPQIGSQMSSGYVYPPSIPQDQGAPGGSRFSPNHPQTFGNNNNNWSAYGFSPQGSAQPPPMTSDNVLYDEVANGTRITISESPNNLSSGNVRNTSRNEPQTRGHQMNPDPSTNLQSNSNKPVDMPIGTAGRQKLSNNSSAVKEQSPQLNLYITVATARPPMSMTENNPSQQPSHSSTTVLQTLQSQDSVESSKTLEPKYDLEDFEIDQHLHSMYRRHSIIKAIRKRRQERERNCQ